MSRHSSTSSRCPSLRLLVALAAGLCFAALPAPAVADGLALKPTALPKPARVALSNAISADRAKQPSAFELLARLRRARSSSPSPRPALGRALARLGQQALWPMVEALAFDAGELASLAEARRPDWVLGMVEALGRLRDARSAAVLQAIFAHASDSPLTRAAAEALGRLCDDGAFGQLTSALDGPRRSAAIDGLGQCRQGRAAERLIGLLGAATDDGEAQQLALALGRLSSSWAWKALGPSRHREGLHIRRRASEALVRGYLRWPGDARDAHRVALRMASHPELSAIVRRNAHRGDAATQRELAAFARRLAPAR